MKELTIDKFNENNAVFVNGKRVSDDARFPLCIENETYQNEIREHFYETLNANMERMKNITTSLGCGLFHNDITDVFLQTLYEDEHYEFGSFVADCLREFCSDAIDIKLEEIGVIDRVYGKEIEFA